MFWSRLLGAVVLAYVVFIVPPAILPKRILELGAVVGLVFLTLAAFGRIWCLVFVAGRKDDVLVTEGPYSLVRNPLYAFSFLGALGFGLAAENPILAAILALAFGLYYAFVVRREERFLAERFGATFHDYVARTPRWLPRFRAYHEPSTISVTPARIRAGILESMWFVWAYFILELLQVSR